MSEKPLPTEQPFALAITTELKQRTEAAKPLIELAKLDAGIISSGAQQFLDQTTPNNLRSFINPLLLPEKDNNISVAERAVATVVEVWRNGVRREKQIMTLLEDANLLPISAENLRKAVDALEREHGELSKNLWSRVTKRGKSNTISQQLTIARNYLSLYDQTAEPLVNDLIEVNGSLNTAVDAVVGRLDQLAKEKTEEKPSDIEQEVSKEDVLNQLEEQWLERLVINPLKKTEEAFIERRKREGGYTDINEALDRGNFAQLSQEYVEYIKSRTDAKPRTTQEWAKLNQQWVQEDSDSEVLNTFIDLELGKKYWEIATRLTLYGEETSGIMSRGYSWQSEDSEDKVLDLRPRVAYLRWARLVDNFQPPTPEWVFPELDQARWRNESLVMKLSNAVDGLPRRKPEYGDAIQTIAAEALTSLPSFDRWITLKTYLQDQGLVPQERLDAFENSLILKMVNQVLIFGGRESWPGTTVTQILGKLGSTKALAPLLYYQTYISGASGLYSAGHTNAAAQGTLETLLRETDLQTIEGLNEPQFVKDALSTLKDIPDSIGDEYLRSYLTAGLVARKFREAAQEIRDHYEDPKYKPWLVALLRGMKNSSQPFSQETYDVMLSFLDLDPSISLQQEIVETLASRIHNKEQLGINTRINPDFPLALDSLEKILKREDFDKSPENFTALYFIIQELQQAVIMEGYTEADIARIKLYYSAGYQTSVGIPSQEQMAISHEYRDSLVNQLAAWMKDPALPTEARYVTLQIFDLVGFDYPNATKDIVQLYSDSELAKTSSERAGHLMGGGLNFLRDINLHGYYECLTDLLLRRYLSYGDYEAGNLIISTYVNNPNARGGISEWFKHWAGDVDKYIEENPEKMQVIFNKLNEQILTGPDDQAEVTIKFFSDLTYTYYRKSRLARDYLISDLNKVTIEKQNHLFKALVATMINQERWMTAEEHTEPGYEEYQQNRQFGQETVRLIADKMWGFLDSNDLYQQFWAVYTLNLFGERGEKFREVVDRLLLQTHDLEKIIPNSTKTLDDMRDRLNQS